MSELDLLQPNQYGHDVTANQAFEALSPSALFGWRQITTGGLTFGYYGGAIMVNGVMTFINNGTRNLTASSTNYIEATSAGVVSSNTTGFTPGRIPLFVVQTVGNFIETATGGIVDHRPWCAKPGFIAGRLVKSITTNVTLTAAEARNEILEFTGTLAAQVNVTVPLSPQQWTIFNNTTGGFGIQIIGATGTGTVIGNAKRAIVYSNATNVVRVTPDT